MIWSTVGYDSPLNKHVLSRVPNLEQFRQFVLRRHNIYEDDRLQCDNLNIAFIWRRDYLAHPRNPSGRIPRKIQNEQELLERSRHKFSNHNIRGVQIDLLEMGDQLKLVSRTDILIGMHGAGLTHTLFLPRHAGLIELKPMHGSTENKHFMAMATWRRLHYMCWRNTDSFKERPGGYTIVDVDRVVNMIKQMIEEICK
ncbi:hypothetical protein DPMN_016408 [Dreissena polymorpha]|uniref:Glycosyltransferase 61 catalytic domain-containing protein n=1 Tax=Dreissena polymorpha TaxID=45954 RepID=A0A9D4N9M9_DREPO|nr:hypothetical protein DPMN_016408 [Dreissena polymorpha]